MANEKFTDLPSVANSTLADIICAVQSGVSTQQTIQQVFNLMLSETILNNAGDPNGSVAGNVYQLCWDTTNNKLYICTTTGNAASAVWTLVSSASPTPDITWNEITGLTSATTQNNGYITNNGSQITLTMPTTAAQGSEILIVGKGAGGWKLTYTTNQQIIIGNTPSTITTGSVESNDGSDSVRLICTTANLIWTNCGAPQSAGLTIT